MRAFLIFLLVLAAALIVAGLLAYPAWLLVGLISAQPIHRVLHRLAMLAALIGFYYLWRRYGLADKPSLGFALPRAEFLRQMLIGMAAGALVILPLMLMLHLTGARNVTAGAYLDASLLVKLLLTGLLSGLVVALIEETFFRGALFTAVRRESGALLAVVLPSLLYASLHFLGGRLRIPAEQIEWSSGFAVLGEMFLQYQQPLQIADSFLSLFFVGVLLALVRLRTGAIAASIGMHAAWVCSIAVVRGTSHVNPEAAAGWMIGSYNGVLGWAACGYMLALGACYLAISRGRAGAATATPPQSPSSRL